MRITHNILIISLVLGLQLSITGCNDNTVNTGTNTGSGTIPAAPDNLISAVPQMGSILLNWRENSANEDGFVIERSFNSDTNWTDYASAQTNSTYFLDTGVSAGGIYYYRVYAYNNAGNSNPSNVTSQSVPSIDPNVIEFNDLVLYQDTVLDVNSAIDLLNGTILRYNSTIKDVIMVDNAGNDFYFRSGDLSFDSPPGYETDFGQSVEWTGITQSQWDTLSRVWRNTSNPDTLTPSYFSNSDTRYPGNEFFGYPLQYNSVFAFYLKGKYQTGLTPHPVYGMMFLDSAWNSGGTLPFTLRIDVKINTAGQNNFRRVTPYK